MLHHPSFLFNSRTFHKTARCKYSPANLKPHVKISNIFCLFMIQIGVTFIPNLISQYSIVATTERFDHRRKHYKSFHVLSSTTLRIYFLLLPNALQHQCSIKLVEVWTLYCWRVVVIVVRFCHTQTVCRCQITTTLHSSLDLMLTITMNRREKFLRCLDEQVQSTVLVFVQVPSTVFVQRYDAVNGALSCNTPSLIVLCKY